VCKRLTRRIRAAEPSRTGQPSATQTNRQAPLKLETGRLAASGLETGRLARGNAAGGAGATTRA